MPVLAGLFGLALILFGLFNLFLSKSEYRFYFFQLAREVPHLYSRYRI